MRRPYTPPCLLILSKYTLAPMSSCRDICAVGPDSPADCPSRIRLAVTPVSACAGENNHTNSTGKIRNKQLRCRSCMRSPLHGLDRFRSCLAGTDANDLLNFLNENFAVANLAGACRLDDGVNDRLDHAVVDDNFDLHLGQEIDHIFSAAIQLSVALLTTETFDFGHGETSDADFSQRLAHLVQLERFDDSSDLLHDNSLLIKCRKKSN